MSHTQILKELNIDFLGKRRIAAICLLGRSCSFA